jgi:3-methylfumaryl-CoA hydratase
MTIPALPSITRIDAETLSYLQGWVGKSETLFDTIGAAPLQGLAATLDLDQHTTADGTLLPPLAHWLYFLPRARQSEIGLDGHPQRGGFLPPVPLPRRMWAGGKTQWHNANPLRVGDAARRVSSIEAVTHKSGRTGDLLFIKVLHQIYNTTGLAISEEQDFVYRATAQPGEQPPASASAEHNPQWQRQIQPDEVLLFRYSALTFNTHRIHYDRDYSTHVEGYPGLVVHGPLLATLLADLARRSCGDQVFSTFSFKALRPLFDLLPFTLNGLPSADNRGAQLWAADQQGAITMQASIERDSPPSGAY